MNHKQFFTVIKQHGIDKAEIVSSYTNGRTESIREMSAQEQAAMMDHIRALNEPRQQNTQKATAPGNNQRRTLMSYGYQMDWAPQGDSKKCLEAVDQWARNQKFKKPLMQHTPAELNTLVTIIKTKVYPSYLRDLQNGKSDN